MMVINANIFCGLLDNLASQFLRDQYALCATAKDFAGQLTKEAQEFFSIVIRFGELGDHDLVAVLCDDTQNKGGQNTYTFVIYLNSAKLNLQNAFQRIAFAVILSHEICHFAFYYEFFLSLGGERSSNDYNNFKNKIVSTFEGGIDTIGKTPVDKHTFPDLINLNNLLETIKILENYPKEHFANKNPTDIDYRSFFFHFLKHLKVTSGNQG